MNKYIKYIILIQVILVFTSLKADNASVVYFNKTFFKTVAQQPTIIRDRFIEKYQNKIVFCKGTIKKIEKITRYKRNYRVTILDADADKYGLTITYFTYIENKDTIELMSVNETFEFSGQLITYTPLNMKRNNYIFDILLEKGAMLIE